MSMKPKAMLEAVRIIRHWKGKLVSNNCLLQLMINFQFFFSSIINDLTFEFETFNSDLYVIFIPAILC